MVVCQLNLTATDLVSAGLVLLVDSQQRKEINHLRLAKIMLQYVDDVALFVGEEKLVVDDFSGNVLTEQTKF